MCIRNIFKTERVVFFSPYEADHMSVSPISDHYTGLLYAMSYKLINKIQDKDLCKPFYAIIKAAVKMIVLYYMHMYVHMYKTHRISSIYFLQISTYKRKLVIFV